MGDLATLRPHPDLAGLGCSWAVAAPGGEAAVRWCPLFTAGPFLGHLAFRGTGVWAFPLSGHFLIAGVFLLLCAWPSAGLEGQNDGSSLGGERWMRLRGRSHNLARLEVREALQEGPAGEKTLAQGRGDLWGARACGGGCWC